MTTYIWDPANGYRKGSSKHISTQGFHPSRHPLTISSQGFILPILTDINLVLGGIANTSIVSEGGYIGSGVIIIDGASASISTVLNNIRVYAYEPFGTIDLGGNAPFVIGIDGNIIYDYSSIGADGPDLSGLGDTEYVPGQGLVPEHGGRGVLRPATHPRTFKRTPYLWIWRASLSRKFSIHPSGKADTEFVKGQQFPFIHGLPTVDVKKEEHLQIFKTINDYVKSQETLPTTYEFKSSATKKLIFDSFSEYSFNSPVLKQKYQEEELVLILASDSLPTITLVLDRRLNKIQKDDDFILNLLDF